MANAKRKKVEEYIVKYIGKITHGDEKNMNLYKDLFKSMNDKEFDDFMVKLRDKKITLSIIVPNGGDVKVTVKNNFKVAKEIGLEFFQHLKMGASNDMPAYTTPNKYLVYKLPVRRAAQLLSKKISIPKDDKTIDSLTGQVTGKSQSSKLTLPELQILIGMGMKDSVKELMKTRGGDLGEANALNKLLYKNGQVSQAMTGMYSTGVKSTKTLKQFLNAMHIRSTL